MPSLAELLKRRMGLGGLQDPVTMQGHEAYRQAVGAPLDPPASVEVTRADQGVGKVHAKREQLIGLLMGRGMTHAEADAMAKARGY